MSRRIIVVLLTMFFIVGFTGPMSAAPGPIQKGPLLIQGLVSDVRAAEATVSLFWTPGAMSGRQGMLYPEIVAKAVSNANGRYRVVLQPTRAMLSEMRSRDIG